MRPLFVTQGQSLSMFDAVRAELAHSEGVEQAGYIVADRQHYRKWLHRKPEFERRGDCILREWDVVASRPAVADLELIRRYESELPTGDLFGAIVADRRMIMGPNCTFTQDYRRRFPDRDLLAILQSGLIALDRMFATLRPDVVAGFVCVTFLEYLAFLLAKARGVPVLNLRPTRIENRVMFASTLLDPSPEFESGYKRALTERAGRAEEAARILDGLRSRGAVYEGVVPPSARPFSASGRSGGWAAKLGRLGAQYSDYRRSQANADNHVPPFWRSRLYGAVVTPARAALVRRRFARHYVSPQELTGRRFAFFPLHTEPEVSLAVYGRPFVNQIEVIRTIAGALPADMLLILKEHPWMVGKRHLGAYKKMLVIPRVRLTDPSVSARMFTESADLTTVVTSSVGFDALAMRRPVVTFGHCLFNVLPKQMVRRCVDLTEAPAVLRDALREHRHDERALEAYVAAVVALSAPVNLYTSLLKRQGAYADTKTTFMEDARTLTRLMLARLQDSRSVGGARTVGVEP